MPDGIFVGTDRRRPKSKAEIRREVETDPFLVEIEATSLMHGYSGPVATMPQGITVYFVGPDPYTKRNFYGQLRRVGSIITVK